MFFTRILSVRIHARRDDVLRARLLLARELLVRFGVPYDCIWCLTGFSSRRDMERSWNRIF